jgi:proteasome lid subunit RPN8/RPN11
VTWRTIASGAILFGALHSSDDGDLTPTVRAYLADRYKPEVEHGYCITRWHKTTDATGRVIPVVDEVIDAPNQSENTELNVQFDCGALPTLHTHPPRFPSPSQADIGKGIVQGGLPFIVVQSGKDLFNFWVVSDRL